MLKCKICDKEILNMGALIMHEKVCEKIFIYKEEIKKLYINDFFSIRELCIKFNISKGIISEILGSSVRTYSESVKIGKKKYPLTHTDESIKKIREKRLDFMKKYPEKTSWRQKNISYPELIFIEKIAQIGWDKKYSIIREFSVFPFYIDFAFINEMVAVEVDGSQHLLDDRKKKDEIKDKLLNLKGWSVVRVSEKEIKKNIDEVFLKLEDILVSLHKEKKYEFGVLQLPKTREKKIRLENGLTKSEIDRMIKARKIERPPYDELKKLVENYGFLETGRKYGVSDNSIRKWLKFYVKYP